jgi:hypothetical protein
MFHVELSRQSGRGGTDGPRELGVPVERPQNSSVDPPLFSRGSMFHVEHPPDDLGSSPQADPQPTSEGGPVEWMFHVEHPFGISRASTSRARPAALPVSPRTRRPMWNFHPALRLPAPVGTLSVFDIPEFHVEHL